MPVNGAGSRQHEGGPWGSCTRRPLQQSELFPALHCIPSHTPDRSLLQGRYLGGFGRTLRPGTDGSWLLAEIYLGSSLGLLRRPLLGAARTRSSGRKAPAGAPPGQAPGHWEPRRFERPGRTSAPSRAPRKTGSSGRKLLRAARRPAGRMTKFGCATCGRLPFMAASWAADVAGPAGTAGRAGEGEPRGGRPRPPAGLAQPSPGLVRRETEARRGAEPCGGHTARRGGTR